jgi:DNA-binding IclR family transcriptional regulator
MTTLQRAGRAFTLDTLAKRIGLRREDVRAVLSRLHERGYVDVLRMRVTLAGFAIGAGLAGANIEALRARRAPRVKVRRREAA